jgi:hypothetical protein
MQEDAMKKTLTILFTLTLVSMGMAYSGGPPNGKTGAPGEGTCVDCHSTNPLNSGDGSLTIDAPTGYEPGMTYTITVQLEDMGQKRWGFEFTPLDQGTITITDATNTQLSSQGGNSYVKHTSTGTHNDTNDGPVSWTFDWTAPTVDPPGEIMFYVAGNAADGNFSNSNDYIYTASASVSRLTGVDDFPVGTLPNSLALNNYPNPFNATANIDYQVPADGRVNLSIYDVTGRLVTQLVNQYQAAGPYRTIWNGTDAYGDQAVSGVYFVRLAVDNNSKVSRLVLLK